MITTAMSVMITTMVLRTTSTTTRRKKTGTTMKPIRTAKRMLMTVKKNTMAKAMVSRNITTIVKANRNSARRATKTW